MKLVFEVGDRYTTLSNASSEVWRIIKLICRARPKGFEYMPKFRSGWWDGYISLLKGNAIPTGLLRYVMDELPSDVTYTVRHASRYTPFDNTISNDIIANCLGSVVLRDYQIQSVRDMLSSTRGIAHLATNSGKTLVYAACIKLLGNANSLVVVNTKDLLYQTQKRLKVYLERSVGIIGDSHRDDDDICVATIQTLLRSSTDLIPTLVRNRALIVDECHHVADNRTFDVLMKIPGWYRMGVSGTPLDRGRLNDMKLVACTGPVCSVISNSYLIDDGWSALPCVNMHVINENDLASTYQLAYDNLIASNKIRNEYIAQLALEECIYGSVLIIVNRIKHGAALQKCIGDNAVFVCGSSKSDIRAQALSDMRHGRKFICIATSIFDEGVDVPAVGALILAVGGKSRLKLLQRLGRGMRAKIGDNKLYVHDFIDNGNKHLRRHSLNRLEVYVQQGFDVQCVGDVGAIKDAKIRQIFGRLEQID